MNYILLKFPSVVNRLVFKEFGNDFIFWNQPIMEFFLPDYNIFSMLNICFH